MTYEIEKRFLLDGLPDFPPATQGPYAYSHGFLPGTTIKERVTVRPRGHDGAPGPSHTYKRTVKVGTGLKRFEFWEDIDEKTFQLFWPLTEGRRLSARRWKVPDPDFPYGHSFPGVPVWEVTEIRDDRKLVLCEMELPDHLCRSLAPTSLVFPEWLMPHVLRDVTEDESFEAFHLAR